VAHWCIAGKNRRKLDDYGYWYSPDGRDNAQQKNFYKVEALPQALEKYFHQCIGSRDFHLSLDNLGSELLKEDISSFKGLVDDYFDKIIRGVMPVRAKEFSQKLKELSLARQNV